MDVENKPKIGCVVMAAGNARRFGENKLAAQLRASGAEAPQKPERRNQNG